MAETIANGVNNVWMLTATFLIFFMHAGFAMLEVGQVRSKNVANQLTKNMFTWSLGVLVYFLVGAGISNFVGGEAFREAFGYINGGLRMAGLHRVSKKHERRGLDTAEHGIISYPEFGPEAQ